MVGPVENALASMVRKSSLETNSTLVAGIAAATALAALGVLASSAPGLEQAASKRCRNQRDTGNRVQNAVSSVLGKFVI